MQHRKNVFGNYALSIGTLFPCVFNWNIYLDQMIKQDTDFSTLLQTVTMQRKDFSFSATSANTK